MPEWPRCIKPVPGSVQPILHVSSTGQVRITELRDAADNGCELSKDSLWHIKPTEGNDMPLMDLLSQLIKVNPLTCYSLHMLRQVFEQIGCKIDDRVAERNGAYAGLPWSFDSKWAGRDAAQDAKTISEMLHAASGYYPQVVQDGGMVSGSSDESSIKGLTLNAGFITSHENIAAILPPQAMCIPYSYKTKSRHSTPYGLGKYEIQWVHCMKIQGWCHRVYITESVENIEANSYTWDISSFVMSSGVHH